MARRRIRIDQFQSGLFINGARDAMAGVAGIGLPGYLRRAKGLNNVPTAHARSRWGDLVLFTVNSPHSLYKFAGDRWYAAGTGLYQNGTLRLTSSNSHYLTFVRMPPTTQIVDYLFVVGGGVAKKISRAGAVTNWGIAPPADGMTATRITPLSKTIEDAESTAGYGVTNCTIALEGTIKTTGSNSFKLVVANKSVTALAQVARTLNLAQFAAGPTTSPDQDVIKLDVRVDGIANLEYFAISFDVNDGSFNTSNTYTYRFYPTTSVPAPDPAGTGNVTGSDNVAAANLDGVVGGDQIHSGSGSEATSNVVGRLQVFGCDRQWTTLRVPKNIFTNADQNAVWNNVKGIQFQIRTNALGGCTVYVDNVLLQGSVGMLGDYRYRVTFRNSVTGTRSNANPSDVTVSEVDRGGVTLANIPVSSDPQVNQREIWRTVGNGVRLWRCIVINDNSTTTKVDQVADYAGMNSLANVDILQIDELPTDNLKPFDTFKWTWGPYLGRVWWLDSTGGNEGLVYYSPAGRAEAVQGFINVTNGDDPCQAGVIFNGINFVFTTKGIHRIDNTTEPFIPREVYGAPGTTNPRTVVVTPKGVCYQANDGVRIFNGLSSSLLSPEAVYNIMHGENSENMTFFVGTVATYANDEYVISDGVQTLACNITSGRWREVGAGVAALFHEDDTNVTLAATSQHVVAFELPSVTATDTGPLPFEIQTGSANMGTVPTMIERVHIDSDTGGDALEATLCLDNNDLALGTVLHGSRGLDSFTVNRMGRVAGVRLQGNLNQQNQVYGVELEVRSIQLYILQDNRFFLVNGQALVLDGNVIDLTQGISYYGIEDAISLMNVIYKPEIRRIYVDAIMNGETISPVLEFYGQSASPSPKPLPPGTSNDRRIWEWDVNVVDRLIALQLYGDFTKIQLFQVGVDVHIGRQL